MRLLCYAFFLLALFFLILCSFPGCILGSPSDASVQAILINVDQSGNGDFQRIQDAIDAVPSSNTDAVFIRIQPGNYREKVVVDKPFITLSGTYAKSTIITGDERWLTTEAPTVSILASDFVGRYLTFQNTFGSGGPAVALRVAGERAAFYSCRMLSYQDTLLDESGAHYYRNCYIEGATDFIYGNGLSLFEKCHLHSISQNGGAITAQKRSTDTENTGYSFVSCKITGMGTGTLILGRPWGPYSRVIFANSYMSSAVLPQGWNDWGNPQNQRTAFYGEYQCYGPGSDLSKRVPWTHKLSPSESQPFLTASMIAGQSWIKPIPTHFKRDPSYIHNSGGGGGGG